jgi:hypothetical protein
MKYVGGIVVLSRRQFLPGLAGIAGIPLLGRHATVRPTRAQARAAEAATTHEEAAVAATRPPIATGGIILRTRRPFAGATRYVAGGAYLARGIDNTDNVLWVADSGGGTLRQSSDWGATFSASKGLPANVPASSVAKMLRHKDFVYLYGKDTSTGLLGVYRSQPAIGAAQFSWSGPLVTQDPSVTSSQSTVFASDGTYLFLGDYGDPKGGPRVVRSSDGADWTTSFARDPAIRHVHCIAGDPYNDGHVWMTLGDGGAKIIVKSTDHGATWSTVTTDFGWQGVQLSFDPNWVYIAGDQSSYTYQVVDRASGNSRVASPNWHHYIQPPGADQSTARYLSNSYMGAVDPGTGFYYCVANDTASTGTWMGMFYAPGVGHPLQILDRGGAAISMNGEVFIAGGYVHSGAWRHPRLICAPS